MNCLVKSEKLRTHDRLQQAHQGALLLHAAAELMHRIGAGALQINDRRLLADQFRLRMQDTNEGNWKERKTGGHVPKIV